MRIQGGWNFRKGQVPVSGTYRHDGAAFLGMDIQVSVTRSD
jgi:hypothetical protein